MAAVILLDARRAAREWQRVFWAEVAAEVARRECETAHEPGQFRPRLRVVR
jgi:hypothetical protein